MSTVDNIVQNAANAANAATGSNATNPNTVNAGSSNTADAVKGLNSNFQDFLKLLTTQLQNQDPTAPADTNQLTQEIASLSQVEQQINTNNNLQRLVSLFQSGQVDNAVSYIGKQVDAAGNQTDLTGGAADIVYNLPAGAMKATVTITNSSGATIFTADGTTIAGRNEVFWNGNNGTTGQPMPSGTYNFSVKATDSNGNPVTATTFTSGVVTSVDTQNGNATLSIGDISLPITTVTSIRNAAGA